jgi:CheY-like chemotaxis protein
MALRPLVEKSAAFILSGSETQFRVASQENLWPALIDEDLFGQLVDNLVLNASQAMGQRGCVQISIQNITLAEGVVPSLFAGYYLELTFSDTGTGIPAALAGKIFDPFFTTKANGHGLGLATARSIVRKHGGVLWVDSVEGQGTTFHVVLPALPGGTFFETEVILVEHKGSGAILVMDDEAFNLEILTDILGSMGYRPITAKDGEEALQVSRSQPDLRAAFLDLTVKGGQGGRDTVGPLLTMHPRLPVFAMSGYCEDPILAQPRNFGFTDSLQKPFRKQDLTALLSKHLSNP